MKVRLAEMADQDAVMSISTRLIEESRFNRYPLNPERLRATILEAVGAPKVSCILLAEHDTKGVVGMLAAFVAQLRFADVMVAQDFGFYVLPEHRGGSAALKLMIAFRRWAENRQVTELNINMNSAIDPAGFNRFMRHLGFQCCGANFVLPLAAPAAV